MSRLFKLGLPLFFALVTFHSGIAQNGKFGYVNSALILSELPEVKQADANLEALQKLALIHEGHRQDRHREV